MSEHTPYVHSNINYLTNKVRLAIKDESFGRISREQLAAIMRERASQIEQRIVTDLDQLKLFGDPVANVKTHLAQPGMI